MRFRDFCDMQYRITLKMTVHSILQSLSRYFLKGLSTNFAQLRRIKNGGVDIILGRSNMLNMQVALNFPPNIFIYIALYILPTLGLHYIHVQQLFRMSNFQLINSERYLPTNQYSTKETTYCILQQQVIKKCNNLTFKVKNDVNLFKEIFHQRITIQVHFFV